MIISQWYGRINDKDAVLSTTVEISQTEALELIQSLSRQLVAKHSRETVHKTIPEFDFYHDDGGTTQRLAIIVNRNLNNDERTKHDNTRKK